MMPRSSPDLRRFEPVADILVLAAIDRAERHNQVEGVQRSNIAEHLGFVHAALTTRRLRPQVDALIAAGAVRCFQRGGSNVWGLTSTGRRRLTLARRAAGGSLGLPEAPQHWKWRHARTEAAERIDGLRQDVRDSLKEARSLLDDGQACADDWIELSTRLQKRCARLGAGTYRLHEWAEPDDTHADIDDAHRRLRQLDLIEIAS
jgi:hypothetical protein